MSLPNHPRHLPQTLPREISHPSPVADPDNPPTNSPAPTTTSENGTGSNGDRTVDPPSTAKMGWNLISLVCRQYLPRNHFGYLNKLSIELVIFAKWVDSPVLFLPRNTTFATNAVCYCPPYGGKRPKAPIVAERVVILCDRIHFANLYGKLHFVSSREPGFLRFLA